MESPTVGLERDYIVRIRGSVGQAELDKLGDGVRIDGIHYKGTSTMYVMLCVYYTCAYSVHM